MKSLLCLLLTALAVAPAVRGGTVELTADERLDFPVTLMFEDAPIARVLQGLFGAAGVGMEMDPCVTGQVSITMENVTARQAIESIARMADLTVTQTAPGHTVTIRCAGAPPPDVLRSDGGKVELSFTIDRLADDGRKETVARPRLVVRTGEPATIGMQHNIRLFPDGMTQKEGIEIDAQGRESRLPSFSIEAVVFPASGDRLQRVHGVFEVSSFGEDGALQAARHDFRTQLSEAGREVEATRLDFSGTTYILSVSARAATGSSGPKP